MMVIHTKPLFVLDFRSGTKRGKWYCWSNVSLVPGLCSLANMNPDLSGLAAQQDIEARAGVGQRSAQMKK